jgi:hypothetical protein
MPDPCPDRKSGMRGCRAGYHLQMSSNVDKPGEHTRIEDKKGFTGNPEPEGVPEEEHMQEADVEERLGEDPEEAVNRRDVPED